jgi:2-hydroxychromene-2-carboxylate isomerase
MAVLAKGDYMAIELRRWAARYGVPFRANPHPFMRNTMRLVRGAVAAQKLGVFDAYHDAVYRAVWADAIDLGDDATLAGVLDKTGAPGAEILAAVEGQDVKDGLRRNTDDAVNRGVFGAPTFFVGSEMFWGNDRLDFVEEALRRLA